VFREDRGQEIIVRQGMHKQLGHAGAGAPERAAPQAVASQFVYNVSS
jgi:hypothetical protein